MERLTISTFSPLRTSRFSDGRYWFRVLLAISVPLAAVAFLLAARGAGWAAVGLIAVVLMLVGEFRWRQIPLMAWWVVAVFVVLCVLPFSG